MPTPTESGRRQPVAVEARKEYRIWLRYDDGVEGEVDLSDLVGRGVFEAWLKPGFFEKVHLSERRTIAWNEDLEVCPDALYLEITGRVSRFYGIVVRVNYREGDTPRFHARYAGAEAAIDIRRLALLGGKLPGRALGFVMEWATLHQEELLDAWERSRRGAPPVEIAPLDPPGAWSPAGLEQADRTGFPEFDPPEPVAVEPREGYRIWLRYADGVEGEVDLAHLVGRGVFVAWRDRAFFERVHIGPGPVIAWNEEIDLCPEALYLRLTGKRPEDLLPAPKEQAAHA